MGETLLFGCVLLFFVFGLWCAVHMAAGLIFPTEQIAVAVEIQTKEDAEMLDMLLHEAVSASLRRGRSRIVVLLSADLMDGTVGEEEELYPCYQEILDRFDASCYLIDP